MIEWPHGKVAGALSGLCHRQDIHSPPRIILGIAWYGGNHAYTSLPQTPGVVVGLSDSFLAIVCIVLGFH